MTFDTLYERFSAAALGGLNLQNGQCLAIKTEPIHAPVIERIARHAYRRGGRFVDIWPVPARLERERVVESAAEYLEYVPDYYRTQRATVIRERWAFLSIKSPDDPNALNDLNPERMRRLAGAYVQADADFRRALSNDETQWTVMALPTPRWAAKVLDGEPSEGATRELWDLLVPILRLDAPDPANFWSSYGAALNRRAETLTAMALRQLHFEAEGTDLTVQLHPAALWKGGGSVSRGGVHFMPNLPTEEVFTAPDYRGTTGRVQITRPAMVHGVEVRDAWFEFESGRVVDCGASYGLEALHMYLDTDAGSRTVGEVALVDTASPIFQSGRTFYNTLLDENATCHLALGFAYPTCIRGGESMVDAELEKYGASRSRQHADFMIGTPDMNVTAVDAGGGRVDIMRSGAFVID